MKKILDNKLAGIILAVILLLVAAYAYVPQVLEGKVVNQSDISGYMGMARECTQWDAAHPDDKTAWTNSMFGGMPTTMLTGNTEGDWTGWLYKLMFIGPRPASYLFISLLGAFLLMLALGTGTVVAFCGALAVTFCSYNLQIIQVGHNSKMVALAFAPWVLAAVIYTYRVALEGKPKRWLMGSLFGAALFAMALNFQIKANHVQISYYLAIIILAYAIVTAVKLLVSKKKDGKFRRFATASALLLALGLAGIAANANRLIPTYEYTAHTMRGGSELSSSGASDKGKSKGLDLEYATAWSYGWEELPNLLIPDYNGGSSSYSVNPDKSATIDLLRRAGQTNLKAVAKALPMYWGPQPFTAGPMYMGAVTIFLFIMGLGLCRREERWWILVPTVIAIFLALGNHFMPFTKFWYEHMPFYSKFRTVSMALVVLQLTLPMLAFLTLDRILKGGYEPKAVRKWALISLGITGLFCLMAYTGLGRTFSGSVDEGQADLVVEALAADRLMLLRKDAVTALVSILLCFATLMLALRRDGKLSPNGAALVICALVALNMGLIGKRYLNGEHFVSKKAFDGQFKERVADTHILQDKDPDFRVLDLSVNVFNDSYPSYFHKNIGGYSPVKLQRYQDLIDHYLVPEINSIYSAISSASTLEEAQELLPPIPVLSMLNDRYLIIDGNLPPIVNGGAMGNCWLVEDFAIAQSPDEEIALLGSVDLHRTAVLGKDFAGKAVSLGGASEGDNIHLTTYAPNALSYEYEIAADRTAVFSEIYYSDGWKAQIDGEDVDIFRADWTLRAVTLPAGKHVLTMRFEPDSYRISSSISRASSSLLMLLLLIGALGVSLGSVKKEVKD